MPHAQSISFYLIRSPDNIWWSVPIIKLRFVHGNACLSLPPQMSPSTPSTPPPSVTVCLYGHQLDSRALACVCLTRTVTETHALSLSLDQHQTKETAQFYGGETNGKYRSVSRVASWNKNCRIPHFLHFVLKTLTRASRARFWLPSVGHL